MVFLLSDVVNFFDDGTVFNNENMYLKGFLAPVVEETNKMELKLLNGILPDNFEGLFLRIGPNPQEFELSRKYHWFDGNGMIHLGN